MSLVSARRPRRTFIDIRQGDLHPRLYIFAAGWWFASSQPDQGPHSPARVRALIGRRMTKQARHGGAHGVYELPHASDDARLDLSEPPAGPTAVFEGSGLPLPIHQDRPSPATAQQRVQVSHREDCLRHDAGDHQRGEVVGSSRLVWEAGPPPPGSSELPSPASTNLGRGDSARIAPTVGNILVVHVPEDVAA